VRREYRGEAWGGGGEGREGGEEEDDGTSMGGKNDKTP